MALYDEEDLPFAVVDNVGELMDLFGIEKTRYNQNKMYGRVGHAFRRKHARIAIDGMKLSLYLIPISEEIE